MSWRPDREIDELFPDPRDRRLADALRSVHAPEVSADPAFRSQLRRQLMQEAWREAEPRLGWWQRLWSPQRVAWAMAAVGAILIAMVVYSTSSGPGDRTVVIRSNVDPTVPVAAVQPVELTFSQPMNRQSVESALQIEPATSVQLQWTSDTQVKIVPVSGSFAPNTQYTVTLKSNVAQTQQGKAVPAATPAVFTVKPTPTPVPVATPTPAPTPKLKVTVLGPAGDVRPQWNYQNKVAAIGPNGELELFPIDGGSPDVLVPSGVTAFALGPDAGRQEVAFIERGQAFLYTGRAAPASPAGVTVLAVGVPGPGTVAYATATSVVDGQGHETKLGSAATSAWFAPGATRLLYQSADHGLHLVDLSSGKEMAWPAVPATFLGWSPDGSHALYSTPEGVFVVDAAGQSPVRLGSLPAATAADWPASGPLVVESGGQLHQVAPDGGGDRTLGPATAASLAVSGTGSIALAGGGQLALVQPNAGSGGGSLSVETAAPVVGAFEKARMAGDQSAAAAVTASSARVATPATGIQRWFTVAAFAAPDGVHEVARVVLADRSGKDVSQLDEAVLVTAGPDGKPVVASATDSDPRPYGSGPEVLAVSAAGGRFSIELDSDLTPASVTTAIRLTDAGGKPVAATTTLSGRTATLTPAAALAPGSYHLVVGTALQDANGRPALAEFAVDIPITAG